MDEARFWVLGSLDRELSGLIAGSGWAGGAAVLSRARSLLELINSASDQNSLLKNDAGDSAETPRQGWQAIRITTTEGQEILCSNPAEDAQVRGQWLGGKLSGVWVQAGQNFWSSQGSKRGDVWVSSQDETPGPGDQSFSQALEERLRFGLGKGAFERSADVWECTRCGWENEAKDLRCRGCLAPGIGGRAEGVPAGSGPAGGMEQAPASKLGTRSASGEMEMPVSWAPLVDDMRNQLCGQVTRMLKQVSTKSSPAVGRQERKCARCGQPLSDEHRFCIACGAPQTR